MKQSMPFSAIAARTNPAIHAVQCNRSRPRSSSPCSSVPSKPEKIQQSMQLNAIKAGQDPAVHAVQRSCSQPKSSSPCSEVLRCRSALGPRNSIHKLQSSRSFKSPPKPQEEQSSIDTRTKIELQVQMAADLHRYTAARMQTKAHKARKAPKAPRASYA